MYLNIEPKAHHIIAGIAKQRVLGHPLSRIRVKLSTLRKLGLSLSQLSHTPSPPVMEWEAHPHARTYRSKTLPNYCDLELIFRNVSENEICNLHQEKNQEDAMSETKAANSEDHPDAISYKNNCLYLFHDLCKIFGNKVMEVSDTRVSDLEQLHLMETNDFTIEMDMDGTPENLGLISNIDISDQDPGRAREMDMDGSFGNLVVSGSNEIDIIIGIGTSGNLNVTSNNEISNQDIERPREMDMDMTSGNLDGTGDGQIFSRDRQSPNEMATNGTCGNLVMSSNTKMTHHVRKRPSTMSRDSRPPKKELRMKDALSEMASAVKALMNKKEKNNTSFEDALSALQAMPDIDEELVMDACDLLEDETKAKIFLALDISLRKKWLLRKLRQ
ncbi:polyubiquitin protein [Spatholobus suberectus]|nr:polyubiquitin protein [Spatholobus suberectus]